MELLQTDPEYMLECVSTLKANLRFKDYTPTTTAKWNLITMDLMGHRMLRFSQWAHVVDAFQSVHEVFEKHRDNIRPGATLPSEVGIAMCVFSDVTDEAAFLQCDILSNALYHMEALKDLFAIVRVDGRLKWKQLRPQDPSRHSDRILACATAVQNAMNNNRLHGARLDVQLLLRKLSSINYEKAVDEDISSIALLDEMRVARSWSQLGPFAKLPPEAFLDAHTADEPQPSASTSLSGNPPLRRLNRNHPSIQRLSPLLRKFFEAPWPKDHKSPAWLDKVTESRKHLSAFWQTAREEWKRIQQVDGELHPKMRQLIDPMAFDVSQSYLEEVRKERELGEAEVHRMQAAQTRQVSFSQALQTTWGDSDNSTAVSLSNEIKRTKTKTTGTSTADSLELSTLSLDGGSDVQSGNEQIVLPPISVKQDSLTVFRKMYPSSINSTLGSIKWTQLVQALTDAGLVATQAPGSAVTFASADKGHINFHKPHAAEPVVDGLMLRRMGKRLKKWFGWEGDRFVLRAKEG